MVLGYEPYRVARIFLELVPALSRTEVSRSVASTVFQPDVADLISAYSVRAYQKDHKSSVTHGKASAVLPTDCAPILGAMSDRGRGEGLW